MTSSQLLVLVALALTFCGATATFPYCRCTDYSFAASPYVLGAFPSSALEGNGVATASFVLVLRNVSAPPKANPSLPCFGILSKQGIQKLTIDTSDKCDGNVDIFVDGELCPKSMCWVETKAAGQTYIRIGFKPPVTTKSFSSSKDAIPIRLEGRGPCGTLAALLKNKAGTPIKNTIYKYALFHTTSTKPQELCCPHSKGNVSTIGDPRPAPPPPPPPSTPPPSDFPYCKCNKRTANTPFEMDNIYVIDNDDPRVSDRVTTWSVVMRFKKTACNPARSKCCNMDFKKIELPISMECRQAITRVRVDGVPRSASFTDYKNGRLVLKITKNALSADQMDGISIAFDIKKGTTCNTFPTPARTLFTEPLYALFGNGQYQKCCPTRPLPEIGIILP